MKNVLLALIIVLTTNHALAAEIESKADADAFLAKYCVALINEIAEAVKRQEDHSKKNEWQQVGEQGAYIAGVADVYSKLCVANAKST
ncbi:hypothetical protein EYC98_19795 [Halieaceae bacterium IMCC14734]|uniref:Uncharacterized protein n=1 Tax=Candidatus Litorirhabdus singularis TaxID=2518993 RepID=A0ABT3TLA6_9GAMM|nr:hypothetical protein [Candidatus Litorirhabdus singularis]MCX2983111.1 hypothetical protein [Candidatus Litorirhabdus singularis]